MNNFDSFRAKVSEIFGESDDAHYGYGYCHSCNCWYAVDQSWINEACIGNCDLYYQCGTKYSRFAGNQDIDEENYKGLPKVLSDEWFKRASELIREMEFTHTPPVKLFIPPDEFSSKPTEDLEDHQADAARYTHDLYEQL